MHPELQRLTWWCVFGSVRVRDRVWRTANLSYLRPLPERVGVRSRGRSGRLDRVLTDFGCEHSFVRAAASVREANTWGRRLRVAGPPNRINGDGLSSSDSSEAPWRRCSPP